MSELFAAFGINWKLLLVQAVNFSLLLVVLWRYLYTPILGIIDERQKRIAEGVKTAEEASVKLADAEAKCIEIVGQADRDAESILATARGQAGEKGNALIKEAETLADGILRSAMQRAEETKRQILLQSGREVAKAAMLAAEKILKQSSA